MDTNAQRLQTRYGWHAHAGSTCGRCGFSLGPFQFQEGDGAEVWGCADCGIGVAFGDERGVEINAAADRYVSMCKTVSGDTRKD